MGLVISSRVRAKLASKVPPVYQDEIIQCFANRSGIYLIDSREEHQTTPPTKWFIAETDFGRTLKIVFIEDLDKVIIKSAYDPNGLERKIYRRYG